MMHRSNKSSLSTIIFLAILLIFITSCHSNETQLMPPSLIKALDYFYLENQNKQALIELNKTISQHSNEDWTQLSKIFIAASTCETDDYISAEALFNQIDTVYVLNKPSLKFWYQSINGLIQFRKNKLLKAYSTLSKISENPNYDKRALGLNQRILARIAFSMGENKKGIEWLLLSSENFKKSGLRKSVGINSKILGRYFMNDGNYAEALKNFQLAEKELLVSGDKIELFYVYINFLDYYIQLNNLDKAKWYADLCLSSYKNNTDNQMITLVYNNMGEIAYYQQNYSLSTSFFEKTLALPSNYNASKSRRTNSNLGISKNYSKLNKPYEALQYAKIAQLLASSGGLIQLQYEANLNLAKCYNDLQISNLAYLYQDTAIQFRDSVFKEAALSNKAFYDTKTDLAKVASEMDALKHKEKRQRISFILIFSLLSIITTFTLIVYKLQHSKNKVLRELVKKNLEIIEDERKLSASLQNQIPIKKNSRKVTESDKNQALYNCLTDWLETEKRYTQNDLSLELVAKELNTNRDYLSRAINDQEIRFNDLINKYRVQEAIQILSDSTKNNGQLKLSYISSVVGFNSNSAFIDAFKKQTGLNPAEFRKNITSPE